MQTFMPFADYETSAQHLDSKRLVKQNLETRQILNTLCGFSEGWKNHPAVLQWRGHIRALIKYGLAINAECVKRGFKDCAAAYEKYSEHAKHILEHDAPAWMGDEKIHASHRGRLKCKGEIDSLCAGIKKHFKIKKIDEWCKDNFKVTKNQMRWPHIVGLFGVCMANGIKCVPNYYKQFNWAESETLEYVWGKPN